MRYMQSENSSSNAYRPRDLGQPRHEPVDHIDCIPWQGGPLVVTLCCDEFTALCPVTGQPDFGTLEVRYAPRAHLIETKSLKLFLWRYREHGIFGELLVDELAGTLFAQLAPEWIEVEGHFASRGGIRITACARRP